jgi:hypothetical protein
MQFLLLICAEGPGPDDSEVEEVVPEIETWLAETGPRRLLGSPLAAPGEAVTVRRRQGETIVTDGPYAETKEWIAGFDLIDCADMEAAIDIASRHPLAYRGIVEIRQLVDL